MIDKEVLAALIGLGAKAPEIITGGGEIGSLEPVVALPAGQGLHSLKKYFPPARIEQVVTLTEASSFIKYVNRFRTQQSLIFANVGAAGVTFTAVLDYHAAAPALKPDYAVHRAVFAAKPTPEWEAWLAGDRKLFEQTEFADWIENNLAIFTAGSQGQYNAGTELLELVKSLHGHKSARWERKWNPQTGAHTVVFDEDVTVKSAADAQGELEVPTKVCAGISMFLGGQPFEIPARLKTRCPDRKLQFYYEMDNKAAVVRTSVMLLVDQVAKETTIQPLLGSV